MRKRQIPQLKETTRRNSTLPRNTQLSRPQEPLRFHVGSGNNGELVRRVLLTRKGWAEAESSKEMFINLRWNQSSKGFKYENCIDNRIFRQSLNHLEFHQELSNKEYLFKNVYEYCQRNRINAFDFLPLTFVLNLAESNFEQEQAFFLKFYNQNKPEGTESGELMLRRKKLNPNNFYNLAPKTGGSHCKYQIKNSFQIDSTPYLWILKPTFFNRGNGIHLFSKLSELQELMSRYMHGVAPPPTTAIRNSPEPIQKKSFRIREVMFNTIPVVRTNSFVAQKYMEKPMLVHGRKFDMRVWVLVTHQLKVYLFREGYLRTSSYHYTMSGDRVADLNVHLTNNSVQKYNEDYGRYQSGNMLGFDCLRELVKQAGQCFDDLMGRIKDIVKLTMLSVRKKLNKQQRCYCFEIFGYDFMLDQECKPWLIEVNTNPSIEESSPLLQQILPRMLDDAFALTIDHIFDSKKSCSHFPIQRESDQDNLWDLVVDLRRI